MPTHVLDDIYHALLLQGEKINREEYNSGKGFAFLAN